MTLARSKIPGTLGLAVLAAALIGVWPATSWADDYGDVNQLLRAGKHATSEMAAQTCVWGSP